MLHKVWSTQIEIYKSLDGTELAVLAATWELNPKVTFEALAPEFKANPQRAWRNFGSRLSGGGLDLAIKDPDLVLNHIDGTRMDPWDYTRGTFHTWFRGRPQNRTFIHIDLAKSKDAAGIAAVHRERNGVVIVDFMHAHRAKSGHNIQFEELREQYVYGLHARGFTIQMVTFDQWQSIEMRQILEARGFATDEVSADKTPAPYETLIEMMLTDRCSYYNHPVFVREMQQLRTDGKKYDHPKHGSKDVGDAVACAAWKSIEQELENPKEPPGKIRVHRRRLNPRQYERVAW